MSQVNLTYRFVEECTLGPIGFCKNGDLDINGNRFAQSCTFENCVVGGNGVFDFKGGKGSVRFPLITHHFRYLAGRGWEYAREVRGGRRLFLIAGAVALATLVGWAFTR